MNERIHYQGINFEWDADKAYANFKKHGIDFRTAVELFFDPFLMALEDKIEEGELRHHAVGLTKNWQVIFVAFVWRGDDIRIISARVAASNERKRYERG
ncbi:MAG: BrnT family toxin [Anaerolineales bacterium]|nr:BrnT family toxin [Anaerolineales bacterium]